MTKEQFLRVTRLDEYEVYLNGKKVKTESADPIRPLPSTIGKEQSPRFSGKTKEIVKLNKKFSNFKTFRMNRSNWENQSKSVSGTGRVKSNETV
jgi:hypothetical protein